MSGREWKPGDVAMIEVGCWANRHIGIFDGGGWRYGDNKWTANAPAIITARPLVVIDAEDREAVRRVLELFGQQFTAWTPELDSNVTKLQAALREFANPTPEEPTVRGSVVKDSTGLEWVRVHPGGKAWVNGYERWASWTELLDIGVVEVVRA